MLLPLRLLPSLGEVFSLPPPQHHTSAGMKVLVKSCGTDGCFDLSGIFASSTEAHTHTHTYRRLLASRKIVCLYKTTSREERAFAMPSPCVIGTFPGKLPDREKPPVVGRALLLLLLSSSFKASKGQQTVFVLFAASGRRMRTRSDAVNLRRTTQPRATRDQNTQHPQRNGTATHACVCYSTRAHTHTHLETHSGRTRHNGGDTHTRARTVQPTEFD